MTELSMIICFLAQFVMASASLNYSAPCESRENLSRVLVIQGEALRLCCPNSECGHENNDSMIFWSKNGSDGIQPITTQESERVHYHGGVLYFLPLTQDDTGLYLAQWWYSVSEFDVFATEIIVYKKFHTDQLYNNLSEQISIVPLDCPGCQDKGESITWYRDFHLIPNESKGRLHVYLPSEGATGIYTCMCTWEHHGKLYNSSGSLELHRKEHSMPFIPTFRYPKNNSVEFVDLGLDVKLNCLVFFGVKRKEGTVYWEKNNTQLPSEQRIDKEGISSSVTISQVSEKDLQQEYCCKAMNMNKFDLVCISLRSRESLVPVVLMFSSILMFLLLVTGMLKWFMVDLVLFFRSFRIMQRQRDDGKVYDAYVIYQKDNTDERKGRKLALFVNKVLPSVLENYCSFKLYIHGRDDLPGEDCTELVEMRMQQSRRLLMVLPPGDGHHQGLTSSSLSYEWHVGLHQVLVEQELRVILIELGDMKDYSHLPLGLQHLLQKSPPLKWDEGRGQATCPSSRFWKQVRYMMPVPPCYVHDVDF